MNDKIKDILSFAYKDLIDKAYKTDSIAKNKWRIENREQLREQRKKELKELMEKDKTMSNNKQQSSVEKLFQEMLGIQQEGIKLTFDENLALLEKYKAIHKMEHFNTWWHGISENEPITFEQYYNETFGGNNEQL